MVPPTTTTELRLPEAVAFLRAEAGLSQRDLSARAGLSPGLVSKIERREITDPTFATASRLCVALGMTPREIFYLMTVEARGVCVEAVTPPEQNRRRWSA